MSVAARPGTERDGRAVALLLACAAAAAAIIATRAAFLSSDASGAWQEALRVEVKRGAAAVETIRHVYSSEARIAFAVARASVRQEEFSRAAGEQTGEAAEILAFEAAVQQRVVDALLPAAAIASDPRYARPSGGFDLVARLADVRAEQPDLVALDPEPPQQEGDDAATKAVLLLATVVPVALTLLIGSLAQAFARRRRALLVLGTTSLSIGATLAVLVELMS